MSVGTHPGAVGAASGRQDLAKQIESAFEGSIPKSRLSVFYQLALLVIALLVVTLPLIYIAIIVGAGYGVYQYAIHGMEWVGLNGPDGGRGARFKLFAYIAPLLMGIVLIGFMIKPFLAPRVDRAIGPTLTREDQPMLFDFIERLCNKLGAPIPKRIEVMADVNAFAAFRRGWLSFFGRDLILSIGLPLAAGLSVRQLGGIIAHEFGHFRQGTAMRLDYVIRSVNRWFARVVYTRDGWDEQLYYGARSGIGYIAIFCLLMQFLVWLTRRILWVLMITSHMLSCFMSRQMEYDADRAFAAVAGSPAVGASLARITLLNAVMDDALHSRGEGMSSQDLYDNLPEYVSKRMSLVSRESLRHAYEHMMKDKTGWFDTHPSLRQRIKHVSKLDAPGILAIDRDASCLFNDFRQLSKAVTYAFYRQHLEDRLERYKLVSTDDAMDKLDEQGERAGRLDRYLGVYLPDRPPRIVIDPPTPPENAKQVLEELKAARDTMAKQREAMKSAHKKARVAERELLLASVSRLWSEHVPAEYRNNRPNGVMKPDEVAKRLPASEKALKEQRQLLQQLELAINQRIGAAMKLMMSPDLQKVSPKLYNQRQHATRLLETLRELAKLHPTITRLDTQRGLLMMWVSLQQFMGHNLGAQQYTQQLVHKLRSGMAELDRAVESLSVSSPSEQPEEDGDTYAVDEKQLADAERGASDSQIDFTPLTNAFELYEKSLGELVGIAESVEQLLRLKPVFQVDASEEAVLAV